MGSRHSEDLLSPVDEELMLRGILQIERTWTALRQVTGEPRLLWC